MRTALALAVVPLLVVLAGCGEPEPAQPSGRPSTTAPAPATPTRTPTPTPDPTAAAPTTATPEPEPEPEPEPRGPRRVRGIDVSHHQGDIAWEQVAGDGVSFAYLKATEGSTFTDPRFADNHRAAAAAGLRVGAYHYFTLCSDPLPQADHFVATIGAVAPADRALPPVVDLELIGNCDPPPPEDDLRASVVAFIDRVERAVGRRVVVYTHPDLDARYDFTDDLDRRRWVRRPGDVAPPGDWWLWQRADDAAVAGVDGPVDLDVMRVGRGA